MATRSTRLVGITPGSALALVAAVFAAYILRNAFVDAHRTIGWVVACSIVAMLVDPIVRFLQRHLPRWLSIIVVVLGVVGVVVGVAIAFTNQLLDSLGDLEQAVPDAAKGLERRFDWAADVGVSDRVRNLVADVRDAVRDDTVSQAVGTVPTYLVTGILMLFLLGWGPRYLNGLLDQFDGRDRRRRSRAVIARAVHRGRVYLLCTLAHAVVNGVLFGLLCWFLDLPAPLCLGTALGVLTPFPLVGVVVGGLPALLLAFGDRSWGVAIAVLIAVIVLQTIEAVLVRRLVDVRTLRLGPTVPIVVALLAYELYGLGAAAYGVALAVFGLAAVDAIGWAQGDDPHPDNLEASGIA